MGYSYGEFVLNRWPDDDLIVGSKLVALCNNKSPFVVFDEFFYICVCPMLNLLGREASHSPPTTSEVSRVYLHCLHGVVNRHVDSCVCLCWIVRKALEMVSFDSQTRVSYIADRIPLHIQASKSTGYGYIMLCPHVNVREWMCRAQLHGCKVSNHESLRHLRSTDTKFSSFPTECWRASGWHCFVLGKFRVQILAWSFQSEAFRSFCVAFPVVTRRE
jgi:hypothetical protein